jgi:hypothetical protein
MKITLNLATDSAYFDELKSDIEKIYKKTGSIDNSVAERVWGRGLAEEIFLSGPLDPVGLSTQSVMNAARVIGQPFPFVLLKAGLLQDFERDTVYVDLAKKLEFLRKATMLKVNQVDMTVIRAVADIAKINLHGR